MHSALTSWNWLSSDHAPIWSNKIQQKRRIDSIYTTSIIKSCQVHHQITCPCWSDDLYNLLLCFWFVTRLFSEDSKSPLLYWNLSCAEIRHMHRHGERSVYSLSDYWYSRHSSWQELWCLSAFEQSWKKLKVAWLDELVWCGSFCALF